MWLSWRWGMGLVWVVSSLYLFLVYGSDGTALESGQMLQYMKEVPYVLGVLLLFTGVPALLGGLVRQYLMRLISRISTSTFGLLLGTTVIFEVVVLGFWILWQLYLWLDPPISNLFAIPKMQHPKSSLWLFFILSLPWLLSSVAAAWWVRCGTLRAAPVSADEN